MELGLTLIGSLFILGILSLLIKDVEYDEWTNHKDKNY